jgi:hypothetical protein
MEARTVVVPGVSPVRRRSVTEAVRRFESPETGDNATLDAESSPEPSIRTSTVLPSSKHEGVYDSP